MIVVLKFLPAVAQLLAFLISITLNSSGIADCHCCLSELNPELQLQVYLYSCVVVFSFFFLSLSLSLKTPPVYLHVFLSFHLSFSAW